MKQQQLKRYEEYLGLSVAQLREKLIGLLDLRRRISDRQDRINFINSEIVLMTGRS